MNGAVGIARGTTGSATVNKWNKSFLDLASNIIQIS